MDYVAEVGRVRSSGSLPPSSARWLSVYVDAVGADGVRVTTICEVGQVRLYRTVGANEDIHGVCLTSRTVL